MWIRWGVFELEPSCRVDISITKGDSYVWS